MDSRLHNIAYNYTIKILRGVSGATIKELSYSAGIHYQTLYNLEKGEPTTKETLQALTKCLRTDLGWFMAVADFLYNGKDLQQHDKLLLATYIRLLASKGIQNGRKI